MTGTHNKTPIITLILLGCMSLFAAETRSPLDPTRDIYQIKPGFPSIAITWPIPGGLNKVRLPDPITVKDLKRQLEMQDLKHKQTIREQQRDQKRREHTLGSCLKIGGWVLVALGVAGHFVTTWPPLQSMASSIITVGICTIAGGLGIQKTAEYDKWLTVALGVAVAVFICYKYRKFCISHVPGQIRDLIDKSKNKHRSGSQNDK